MKMMKCLLLGVAFVLFMASTVIASEEARSKDFVIVRVGNGSTLWSICDKVKKDYADQRDIREIVFYTEKMNDIPMGGIIHVGQAIKVSVDRRNEQ